MSSSPTSSALFPALAGAGLDKDRHPEIGRATQPIGEAFLGYMAGWT
jgi:hypothetical protein